MKQSVSVEIPRDVLRATRMTPDELRRELAVHLYQQGRLSFGKAREMADMTAWDFQQLLGSRAIPVHYDADDYEADRRALEEMARE
jgi:predicted HTH domain antitoxin